MRIDKMLFSLFSIYQQSEAISSPPSPRTVLNPRNGLVSTFWTPPFLTESFRCRDRYLKASTAP